MEGKPWREDTTRKASVLVMPVNRWSQLPDLSEVVTVVVLGLEEEGLSSAQLDVQVLGILVLEFSACFLLFTHFRVDDATTKLGCVNGQSEVKAALESVDVHEERKSPTVKQPNKQGRKKGNLEAPHLADRNKERPSAGFIRKPKVEESCKHQTSLKMMLNSFVNNYKILNFYIQMNT